MALEKVIEIKADNSEAIAAIEEVGAAAKKTEREIQDEKRKTASAEREAKQASEKALREIDKLTGGVIGKTQDYAKSLKAAPAAFSALKKSATSAFNAATAGANGLKKALIASGIGALVVALGLIVAYWDDILGLVNGVSSAQKNQLADAEANVAAQEAAAEQLDLQENSLRLQGKSEKEIRDLKIQQTNEIITALEAQIETQKQIKKSQVEAAERNKTILQGIIRFLTLPLSTLLATIDMVGEALGKDFGLEESFTGGLASLVFDPEEVAKEGDAAIEETEKKLAQMKSKRDGFLLAEKKENENAAKAKQDAQDVEDEKARKKQEDLDKLKLQAEENFRKQQQDLADKYDQLVLSKQESAEQQEINAIYDKFFALEEAYAGNAEALALITEQREKELAEINDKYRKQEKEAQEKSGKERIAARQELTDLIVDSASSLISNLKELNNFYDKDDEQAARRAFERNKSLQIAQAIISTSAAIMAQLAVPQDALTGANFVKAGIAATTGAVQIATIARQQFKSGGSTSTPKAPTTPQVAPAQPSFNIVGASGTNQLATSIGSMFETPIKAYVVSGEVSSAQSMDRNRVKTATFG
jgi:hypothetical protein